MPDPQAGQFQYVKLPDGSYGKFAAAASDDQIRTAVAKDFPQAFPQIGPDDPNGNYDFGDLGKVQGARMNGKPATRQQAYQQQMQLRGFGGVMGETLQNKQQDVHNFIQSATDPDQATKGYLGDLASMLVTGGASRLAKAGRWGASEAGAVAKPTQQLPFLKPSQPAPPPQVAEQPVATERGTWAADPRTGEQILQSVQNARGGGQGKVAMGVNQGAAPAAPANSRPGFGTATTPIEESTQGAELLAQRAAKRPPVQSPVSQEAPVTTPGDMDGYYGKSKSNLKANQRQLASPTFSTAPGQPPAPGGAFPFFSTKENMSPEDYAFQDANTEDILSAAIGQQRLKSAQQLPFLKPQKR